MKTIAKLFSSIIVCCSAIFFVSCGNTDPLDGTWKFDDGTKISFNTKKGTYRVAGIDNSASGSFMVINGGTMLTTDSKGNQNSYMVSAEEKDFVIDYGGDFTHFTGKKIDSLKNINGTYKGTVHDLEINFVFDKPSSTLKIFSGNDENAEPLKYFIDEHSYVLFTSGAFASGFQFELEYLNKDSISLDGEVLVR